MSRISINQASKDFKVSRNTIYKYISQGKLTRDSDGKVDSQDMVRLFSEHASTAQEIDHCSQCEQLQQQLALYEQRINDLKQQLEYVKANETWLKQQLDQKLIEHKETREAKKSFLNRIFG